MMDQFEVSRARVFLELSGVLEILGGGSLYDADVLHRNGALKWFCQAADRELELGGALNSYAGACPQIPIEYINGLEWDERDSFFGQRTNSPWDCCSIDRKAIRFKEGIAYLLVEYQLKKSAQVSEEDRKIIYLEGKGAFAAELSQIESECPNLTHEQALQKAFLALSIKMRKKYGIPQEILAAILKEGHEKWRLIHEMIDSSIRFSLSHHPRSRTIREFFYPNDDDPIKRIAENMAEDRKAKNMPKVHEVNYTPVVVRRNVTGVEDAIDVEHEMRMEEMRKNRTNNGGPL